MYAALREAHPLYFGDPLTFYSDAAYRGPAYGEKLGGGGALVGAVLAVATGGASLGFTTLASTLTTISVIGGIVGAVTGNKTFSTIGALAGLGGAFMSLSSAGSLGDGLKDWSSGMEKSFGTATSSNVSSAATPGASDTLSATDVQQAMDMNAGANAQPVQDTGSYNLSQTSNADTGLAYDALKRDTGLINTNPGDGSTISPETAAQKDALAGVTIDGVPGGNVTPTTPGTAPATPAAAPSDSVASKVAGTDSGATMVDGATPAQVEGIAKQGAAQTAGSSSGGLFDKLSSFVEKNKALTEMALKGVSSAYVSPQDKARAEYLNAMAANTEAQTANMNSAAGVDVASMFKVNPNAQVFKPKPVVAAGVRPAGLIQSRT